MIRKYLGEVVSYDHRNRTGKVLLSKSRVNLPFYSTSFYSGLVVRDPRSGDQVLVAISVEPEVATVKDIQGVWVTDSSDVFDAVLYEEELARSPKR